LYPVFSEARQETFLDEFIILAGNRVDRVYINHVQLAMPKFGDAITDESRRKWPGAPARSGPAGPGRPDVEYDPFVDLEDIDEIAALMSQPPGNGREDDE